MSSLDNISAGDTADADTRKLVILGLPWDTTEASLEQYFLADRPFAGTNQLPSPRSAVSHCAAQGTCDMSEGMFIGLAGSFGCLSL